MKLYLSFTACITMALCCCFSTQGKGNYRIPFRDGCYWGLSDEHGDIIIPCKYSQLQCSYPYVFVTDTGKQSSITIFDYNGLFIDTCVYYVPTASNEYCIFHENKTGKLPELFRYNDVRTNMYQTEQFRSTLDITLFHVPLKAYTLKADNSRKPVPGSVNALAKDLNCAVITMEGKCGLYDIKNDSFIIAAAYDSMVFIKPALLLAYRSGETTLFGFNGRQYPLHPAPDALYIDITTLNYVAGEKVKPSFKLDTISQTIDKFTGKPVTSVRTRNIGYAGSKTKGFRLISKDGVTLIPAEREWQYMPENAAIPVYIRMRKSYDSMKYGESGFQIADLSGQIFLRSAGEVTHIEGNLYHITDVGPGKREEFVYDMAQKKTVPIPNQQQNISPDNQGFYSITKDRVHYYYTNNGVLITTVADTISSWQKEWNLVKKIDLRLEDSLWRKTGVFTKTYYAFRSTVAEHFVVYDQHYNKVNTDYEGFTPFISSSKWIAFKKNGKWGLVNCDFKEVIPPIYDSMLTNDDNYATGILNGVRKKIDMKTKHAVDVSHFDEFGKSSFGNKYLAVKYMPRLSGYYYSGDPKIKTVYLADPEGKITDSLEVNDQDTYQYYFTGTGKIIKYTKRIETLPETMLYDNLHAKPRKCPYPATPELLNGRVILLQCSNDDKLGVIAADDFSIVVPFGKYDFMFTYPTPIPAIDKGADLETVIIKGGTNAMHDAANNARNMDMMLGKPMQSDREVVGHYSADGHKYWKN